ncbi:MAG: trigger factor [Candidatus Lambdaproteobacteria bacterium]|nr:trigger factor [Candidatus Lambdaproteobacteria bacterium]
MNVTVEDLGNLKRKLSVEIPLSEVQAAYEEVYGQIRSNVRIKGFRPGKFPRALAEKRFKTLMEQEATRNLVPKYFDLALKEKDLSPATEPDFDNLEVDKAKPLKFDVKFEVVPKFELPPVEGFKLKAKPVKIGAKELDERIEQLRRSRATLTDKDGAAESGDTVTFDFNGTMDGTPFEGSTATGQTHELGRERLLPEFDKQLHGVIAGTEKSFDLTFPDDYGAEHLRGKTATFAVKVHKVQQAQLPELDAEFLKGFGELATVEELKDRVKQQLSNEETRKQRQTLMEELAEQIKGAVAFDVPEQLVGNQLHEFEHRLSHDDPEALKDEAKLQTLKDAEAQKIKANLRLQFVLDEYARQFSVETTQDEVQQRFVMQAYMLQQNPGELVKTPFGQRLLMQTQQDLAYNKTMEHLVDKVLGPAKGQAEGAETVDEAGQAGQEPQAAAEPKEQAHAGAKASARSGAAKPRRKAAKSGAEPDDAADSD